MEIKKAISSFVFFIMAAILLAETPYASVVYAEGKRFSVIRDGKTVNYSPESADVIGLPIARGDILQTAPDTYLEILIRPISASVQLAENTTFRCDSDESGMRSEGKLYYGRVRAKVAKLTDSSSYKITAPSLVAGVRGTDFGCDHFYIRPQALSAPDAASASPVLSRVFCFEGHVLVAPVATPNLETVMIAGGEMVESTEPTAATGATVPVTLIKAPVSTEVDEFWKGREFHPVPGESPVVASAVQTAEERQVVEKEIKRERSHKVRLAGSAALLIAGAIVVAPSYSDFQSDGMTSSTLASASFGGVLISSSLVLLIYDLIKH